MKKVFFYVIAILAITITACNNTGNKNEPEKHDMGNMKDSPQHVTADDVKDVKTVPITFSGVDAKAAATIEELVDRYLQIKNALVNDKGAEAANGGKQMEVALRKMDKSLLTAEQKKLYDDIEDGLKEDAEHIGRNGDKIKHQREHFSMMSKEVYELVKAFGAGRAIYHDHCPMYNDNKGAMWLSEIKDVKNPFYGAEMLTCGTVEEMIK